MLISGVLPIMSLHRLPHRQYASFANSLPQLPSEFDIIVVRIEGAANTHRDFHVRRGVVLHALLISGCLLTTDIYYLNVRINVDALALLPEDGNLNGLHSITLASTIDDPEPLSAQNEDPYDAHLSASFVESMWGKAKSKQKQGNGTAEALFNSYLQEYLLRRQFGDFPFENIVKHIAKVYNM